MTDVRGPRPNRGAVHGDRPGGSRAGDPAQHGRRRLRPPPGLDSPSPPGRWARFSEDDASPWALKEAPTTPWARLPVPPRPVGPVLRRRRLPMGLEGGSDHPLGWTPRPPQAGGPGSPQMTPPHGP